MRNCVKTHFNGRCILVFPKQGSQVDIIKLTLLSELVETINRYSPMLKYDQDSR